MKPKLLPTDELMVWDAMVIIDRSTDLHHRFFAPLWPCLEASQSQRHCQEYNDKDFLELGISRVLTGPRVKTPNAFKRT